MPKVRERLARSFFITVGIILAATQLRAADLNVTGNLTVTNGTSVGNLSVNGTLNIGGYAFNTTLFDGTEFYLPYAATISGANATFNTLTVNTWTQSAGNFVVGGNYVGLGTDYNGTADINGTLAGFVDLGDHVSSNVSFTSSNRLQGAMGLVAKRCSLSCSANAAGFERQLDGVVKATSGNLIEFAPENLTLTHTTGSGLLTYGFESLDMSSGSLFFDPSVPSMTIGSVTAAAAPASSAILPTRCGII